MYKKQLITGLFGANKRLILFAFFSFSFSSLDVRVVCCATILAVGSMLASPADSTWRPSLSSASSQQGVSIFINILYDALNIYYLRPSPGFCSSFLHEKFSPRSRINYSGSLDQRSDRVSRIVLALCRGWCRPPPTLHLVPLVICLRVHKSFSLLMISINSPGFCSEWIGNEWIRRYWGCTMFVWPTAVRGIWLSKTLARPSESLPFASLLSKPSDKGLSVS